MACWMAACQHQLSTLYLTVSAKLRANCSLRR
jgi:hypothetical protein